MAASSSKALNCGGGPHKFDRQEKFSERSLKIQQDVAYLKMKGGEVSNGRI
jgi:hypothetical protein